MSGRPPGTGPGWDASYQPGLLQDLWEAIPPGMRLAYFSADTVPGQYRGGLAHQRGRTAGIDLSPLPAAIRQELAWCVFRIIAQGGKVDVTHMRALVRRLGEVISDLGAAAPASLAGLAPQDWQQQFALAVRRRTGALPGPGSVSDLRQQLSRCSRLLVAAYDAPVVAARGTEPRCRSADPAAGVRAAPPVGQLRPDHGRMAAPWPAVALQGGAGTGTLAWSTVELRVAAAGANAPTTSSSTTTGRQGRPLRPGRGRSVRHHRNPCRVPRGALERGLFGSFQRVALRSRQSCSSCREAA